jgi:hypothetical protein
MTPDPALDPALEGKSVTRAALFAALGRVPLWMLTAGATLLLAAFVAWPWHGWLEDTIGHRYAPGEQLPTLDANFTQDHEAALALLGQSTRTIGGWMALLAILANVFFAGGWLQVFLERTEGHSVQRFFLGGARYFFRFLRVLVLTVLLLAVLDYLIYGSPWEHFVWDKLYGVVDGDLETLGDEWTVVKLEWTRQALHLVMFALVLTWATYTRTRLALHETRSALVAGIGTFFTMLTHPIRTVRPMLLLSLVEVAVLALAAFLISWLQGGLSQGSGMLRVTMLGLAGILPVVFGCIVRGARYCAAVQVSRDVVAPLSAPDPWSSRVGGPGGPQYPLAEEDEYGISL